MLLEGKKIIIMGVRNKWSIAWGAAQSAYENGAEIIFTYGTMENKEKNRKAYFRNTRSKRLCL